MTWFSDVDCARLLPGDLVMLSGWGETVWLVIKVGEDDDVGVDFTVGQQAWCLRWMPPGGTVWELRDVRGVFRTRFTRCLWVWRFDAGTQEGAL